MAAEFTLLAGLISFTISHFAINYLFIVIVDECIIERFI